MWLKVFVEVVAGGVFFIVSLLDYKFFDKRTKKFRWLCRGLFFLLSGLLILNVWSHHEDEKQKRDEVGKLENGILSLNKQKRSAEDSAAARHQALSQQINRLDTDLAPFLSAARKFAPGINDSVALRMLAQRIGALEERTAVRKLTPEQKEKMIKVLKTIPPSKVIIATLLGDKEAIAYARQFRGVFDASSWVIQNFLMANDYKPDIGIAVRVNHIPHHKSRLR